MNKKIQKKIEKFFSASFVKDTTKLAIMKNPDGSYELFDRYVITPVDNKYILTSRISYEVKEFYSLKNAVTYCIFSVKNKINESNIIYRLDQDIEGVNFSITLLSSLISKTKTDKLLIYFDKLTEEKAKKKRLFAQIDYFHRKADRYQYRTFQSQTRFVS